MPTISRDDAERQGFLRDRVCSDCWGELARWSYDAAARTWSIHCETPGCECRGTISRATKEILEARSCAELLDAKFALRDAIPWINKSKHSKTVAAILHELGFPLQGCKPSQGNQQGG